MMSKVKRVFRYLWD